jgi:hypothetical protein
MMFTKRLLLAALALAAVLPLLGCRHCCHKTTSSAPPCCPPAGTSGFMSVPPATIAVP